MLTKATLLAIFGLAVVPVAMADPQDRIYDFTDAYYLANGVNPAKLAGRKQAPSNSAVFDTPFFAFQRNVRVISTSSGYGASGNPQFFSVVAGLGPDGFTANAAGQQAKTIAEKYIEYIFPMRGTDPVGLGASRQSVVLDTSNGYFGNDPLGLWLHVWINYTDRALNTADGQKALADLQKKNGLGKDGLPIVKTKSDLDNLFSKGFITKQTRNDGLRYAVCPVIVDPTDGGIAPDAFYNPLRRADGSLVEPMFVSWFTNLQQFGTWDSRP